MQTQVNAPGTETQVTAKQDRALAAVEAAAVQADEDEARLDESRKVLNAAVKKAHAAGVGYGTISLKARRTRGRVAQIVKGRKR